MKAGERNVHSVPNNIPQYNEIITPWSMRHARERVDYCARRGMCPAGCAAETRTRWFSAHFLCAESFCPSAMFSLHFCAPCSQNPTQCTYKLQVVRNVLSTALHTIYHYYYCSIRIILDVGRWPEPYSEHCRMSPCKKYKWGPLRCLGILRWPLSFLHSKWVRFSSTVPTEKK